MGEFMTEQFDDEKLWDKITNFAKSAGREVIQKALWLYYAAQMPNTPVWAKTVIYGALLYFILPIDAIPDMIPVVGYSDDLGALASAVTAVAMFIDDDVKEKADKKMADWFD